MFNSIGEDIVFLATDINLPGAVDWVMMQSCFDHHFMLVLEKQEKYDGVQLFYAIVQLIGTRKQAENFAYRSENKDKTFIHMVLSTCMRLIHYNMLPYNICICFYFGFCRGKNNSQSHGGQSGP